MRFLAAFGVAILLVLAMLLIGLKLSGFMEREDARTLNLHEVDALSDSQRRALADVLGGEERSQSRYPRLADFPPLEVGGEDQRSDAERAAR